MRALLPWEWFVQGGILHFFSALPTRCSGSTCLRIPPQTVGRDNCDGIWTGCESHPAQPGTFTHLLRNAWNPSEPSFTASNNRCSVVFGLSDPNRVVCLERRASKLSGTFRR
ncbi:hypothetical protein B0T19DRAFT_10549 [Cercophora scortea]|uniref:Uncharacterized protein n=1 Tax=Cercophora scortea TaxID=314031 RepID=A0AAE0J253_9PEZI|nr:hypothetical protein B0T19DRAFT_10549 [Cercophora scortea]